MQGKNNNKTPQNKLLDTKLLLYDLQTFIKFGALASDSNIIDKDFQLNKCNEDYYIFFRTLNQKIKQSIDILDS